MQSEKNPVLAAILSFIVTGLGQLYNGDLKKAIIFFVVQALVLWGSKGRIGTLISVGIWAYGIYDAYTSAAQTGSGSTGIQNW